MMTLPPPDMPALDAALLLALRGFRVTPLHAPDGNGGCTCKRPNCIVDPAKGNSAVGKHPVLTSWQKSATSDPDQVRDQFGKLKFEPNVGIVLGEQPSGDYLVAVDVDDPARLVDFPALQATLRCSSGRGYRLLFKIPSGTPFERLGNRTGLGGTPGIDVKARGGQIVAHGQHYGGARYGFEEDVPIAELPATWVELLLDEVKPPPFVHEYTPQTLKADENAKRRADRYFEAAVRSEASRIARLPEGMRNTYLHKHAISLLSLSQGMHMPAGWGYVLRELTSAAKACGLPDLEVRRTLQNAEEYVTKSSAMRYPTVLNTAVEAPAPQQPSPAPLDIDLIQYKGQAAGIARNVARLLSQHEDWRGGPSLDTYTDTVTWPSPLPGPLSRIARPAFALCKADLAAVQAWCLERGLHASTEAVESGVRLAAAERHTDSLQAWLRGLPKWDGVPRVDRWIVTYLGCDDDDYHRITGRAWLVACVQRALCPGLLVDMVPILEGVQGVGKNRALSALFGAELAILGKFDPDSLALKRLATCKWILHDDEFKGRSKSAVDALKSWVSVTEEAYLAKYENDLTIRKRRALLVLSTNASQYLNDDTGNRRYPPWLVRRVLHAELARDREQLFAECLARLDRGEDWRDGLDTIVEASADQAADRQVVDPMGEQLLALAIAGTWTDRVTSARLLAMLGLADRADHIIVSRLGEAAKAIGARSGRTRMPGSRAMVRWYEPPHLRDEPPQLGAE